MTREPKRERDGVADKIAIAELVVALCLSATVLTLLFVRATHAGALWRDEAGALQLALLPSFAEVARNFQHEAFPLLFPVTLRAYTHFFGASDAALRLFGLVVGVSFVAAAWFVMPPGKKPLLQLGLVGLNTTFLLWGTSVRGYGVGSVLILITFGLAVRALRHPRLANVLVATLVAIASAHCLLHNLTLIAAMALAAIVALWSCRRRKHALIAFSLALVCVGSLLPYLPNYLGAEWQKVLRLPIGFGWLGNEFLLSLGEPGWLMISLWAGATVLFLSITTRPRLMAMRRPDDVVARFVLIFTIVAPITYFGFLRLLSYPTHSWYYLALITALGGGIDFLTVFANGKWLSIARLAIGAVALCAVAPASFRTVNERQSNMGDVAQKLNDVHKDDLVVVNPWFLAPSFGRYYHGSAPWVTLPRISETRFHRFDLIESKMTQHEPLADVEDQIRKTLISGRRVWLVGGALVPQSGTKPVLLEPAPDPEFQWSADAYTTAWSQQIGGLLQSHNLSAAVVLAPEKKVSAVENPPIWLIEGWQE